MTTPPGDETDPDATGEATDGDPDLTGGSRETETDPDATGVAASGDREVSSDDRNWGILAHASAFAGLFVPFGNVLGPLLVWLVKKDESPFVDKSGKEALNFQITWTVLITVAILTIFVGVGLLVVPLVALAWLILVVLATIRASEGEVYDYPLTVDVIS